MKGTSTAGAFDEAAERIGEAVEEGDNVAVVSEPYGGRDEILEAAEALSEADRFSFDSVDDARPNPEPDGELCLVEGCRYLYTRRIDGLGPLETFTETVAASDATYVTSWNSYAWSYARQATDVSDVLPVVVEAPTLGTEETARVLAAEYDVSEFADDYEEATAEDAVDPLDYLPFDFVRFGVSETSDNIFEKIAARSGGNVGVARALFENYTEEDGSFDLSYEDAFALSIVVAKERVAREVVRRVVEPRSFERCVRRLADSGVVEEDNDALSLRRVRLPEAVNHLERRRLVW